MPKIIKNAPKCPKIPQSTSKYLEITQIYVLQDYQGFGGRAKLPPKPEALASGVTLTARGGVRTHESLKTIKKRHFCFLN